MDHSHHAHLATTLAVADPLAVAGFLAVLSFSFMASLHCAFMCAPLVCALLGRGGVVSRTSVALYNLGRLVAYVSAGAALGASGGALLALSAAFGYLLAALLAVFLLAAAFRSFRPAAPGTRGSAILQRLMGPLTRRAAGLPPPLRALCLGLVTVIFPCMTLTPVLALAAASGSALRGAALLAAFQAGTLVVMIVAPLVPSRFVAGAGPVATQRVAVFFLLVAGAVTVFRLLH